MAKSSRSSQFSQKTFCTLQESYTQLKILYADISQSIKSKSLMLPKNVTAHAFYYNAYYYLHQQWAKWTPVWLCSKNILLNIHSYVASPTPSPQLCPELNIAIVKRERERALQEFPQGVDQKWTRPVFAASSLAEINVSQANMQKRNWQLGVTQLGETKNP